MALLRYMRASMSFSIVSVITKNTFLIDRIHLSTVLNSDNLKASPIPKLKPMATLWALANRCGSLAIIRERATSLFLIYIKPRLAYNTTNIHRFLTIHIFELTYPFLFIKFMVLLAWYAGLFVICPTVGIDTLSPLNLQVLILAVQTLPILNIVLIA